MKQYALKRMKKGEVYDDHKQVRYCMLAILGNGGGAINPYALGEVIYQHLRATNPTNNDIEKARNTAYVFACLCNSFVVAVKKCKAKDEFFVSEAFWYWYKIGRRTRENSVKLLQDMEWISYKNRVLFSDPKTKEVRRHRMYTINMAKLHELENETKAFNDGKQEQYNWHEIEKLVNKLNDLKDPKWRSRFS